MTEKKKWEAATEEDRNEIYRDEKGHFLSCGTNLEIKIDGKLCDLLLLTKAHDCCTRALAEQGVAVDDQEFTLLFHPEKFWWHFCGSGKNSSGTEFHANTVFAKRGDGKHLREVQEAGRMDSLIEIIDIDD
jgi:hypothetical protein